MSKKLQATVDWTLRSQLKASQSSLPAQIAGQIRHAITKGELVSGDRLPASRSLAVQLGVARGTITTAYEILIAEDLLHAVEGSGTFVSNDVLTCDLNSEPVPREFFPLPPKVPTPAIDHSFGASIDFRPCRPSLEAFPHASWRGCLSRAGNVAASSDYGDPRGDLRLRKVLVEYLRRARGLRLDVNQIIITNGAVHAMHLVSSILLNASSKVVVENPCYPLAHQTFHLSGAKILPCRVDQSGLVVEELPDDESDVRLVYVTPSHQFPTGSRLSLSRRQQLIRWAEKRGAIIIEDDYDGEFRYDVSPLAPLAALPNQCVIYCGTFSKTLFPGIRIGFAVAPIDWVNSLANFRTITEYAPNSTLQIALASFIGEGFYERHIRKMCRIYASKRKTLINALNSSKFTAQLHGLDSGLNTYAQLRPGLTGTEVSKRAKHAGIGLPSIRSYMLSSTVKDDAVVFGYAALSENEIKRGVNLLEDLLKD